MSILQEVWGDLHKRARDLLGILSAKGLSVVVHNGVSVPSKQASYREVTSADRAVRLHNGQIVWLRADVPREDLGQKYRGIEVFDETPQTDKAIIAVVTALEAGYVKDERLRQAIFTYKLGTEISAEAIPNSESLEKKHISRWLRGWSERLKEAARSDPEFQDTRPTGVGKYMPTFSYAEELLRYFRLDYDELSRREQVALIEGACGRINKFHEALEELVAFAEYMTYDAEKEKLRKLKPAREDVRRDVKAALYKHVEDLSNEEIGARLRTTLRGKGQKDKRDDSTARGWIDRGTALLRQGWGEEGWCKLVASMRSQRERWSNLSEEDRLFEATAEQAAAFAGIPVEEALRIIEIGEPDESKDGAVYIFKAFNRGAEKLLEQNH